MGLSTESGEGSAIPFSAVATAVRTGFEHIHQGMDRLFLKEVSFPEVGGYHIIQEKKGGPLRKVNRREDWTEFVQGYDETRAYWAVRTANNAATRNGTLLSVLKHLEKDGMPKLSVNICRRAGCSIKSNKIVIDISTITSRKIGLVPHNVGTIVEPPLISKVPPSPDGETFHEFLVGICEDTGTPIALDRCVPQYGLEKYCPHAEQELVPYLSDLGTHRLLDDSEKRSGGGSSPFVDDKVSRCTQWALSALVCYRHL